MANVGYKPMPTISTKPIAGSKFLLLALLLLHGAVTDARPLTVAVASNFLPTLRELAAQFEQVSGQAVVLVGGATAKQYAQIRQGAPFDAFFAADAQHPKLLELNGQVIANSRFTYAYGQLALWTNNQALMPLGYHSLETNVTRLAIANPKLAPYGMAARQALVRLGLWPALKDKLVMGENVAQAYQFAHSGNASLALVAYAQVVELEQQQPGAVLLLPQEPLYDPIEQQAVLLTDSETGWRFLSFIRSQPAKALIQQRGYRLP